jgi:hypothetical protein
MSTRIGEEIEGEWQSKWEKGSETSVIDLVRFFAGTKKGRMLQITIAQDGVGGRTSWIQLSQKQCVQLADILMHAFNDEIYPSE